ncbi:PLP-dependent cysteine synthase family protein [Terriglobus saanensis]|uniref:Pyridoxal-5'-phosphate-dependent protein beta subunit n=1 Tax=Terriglobus saanensis (strain ATCC BAA-1853 / DSM 23119 / SP1PR4) TaxID=401053 RepID=E8UXQ5_TERSS|nr:cysteine synthase family protein [Terriglobus saanensis]ADV83071.1 Pyridoxal-5'-phosphate-dependent protein beta subunit [Terriglobus saanensis SP1PR4]
MSVIPNLNGQRVSALSAVGNTQLIQLRKIVPPTGAKLFLKLEYQNPTASYKDRMALSVIEGAERKGTLGPGMRVLEYTGGSTGSSLAMVCAVKGYKFIAVSSDAFAKEKLQTIRAFGGDLHLVPSDEGLITPGLFTRMEEETQRLAAEPGTFFVDQFHNTDAFTGYEQLGRELLLQTSRIDVFAAAVGTAGMLMGVSRVLKAQNPRIHIVALEPASSPMLSRSLKGNHRVEGIGVGYVPALLTRENYDEVIEIEEKEARQMARLLARQEGVFAGISTGLNVVAAARLAAKMSAQDTVVTVAADSGLKYLAGDLFYD